MLYVDIDTLCFQVLCRMLYVVCLLSVMSKCGCDSCIVNINPDFKRRLGCIIALTI